MPDGLPFRLLVSLFGWLNSLAAIRPANQPDSRGWASSQEAEAGEPACRSNPSRNSWRAVQAGVLLPAKQRAQDVRAVWPGLTSIQHRPYQARHPDQGKLIVVQTRPAGTSRSAGQPRPLRQPAHSVRTVRKELQAGRQAQTRWTRQTGK